MFSKEFANFKARDLLYDLCQWKQNDNGIVQHFFLLDPDGYYAHRYSNSLADSLVDQAIVNKYTIVCGKNYTDSCSMCENLSTSLTPKLSDLKPS